MSAFKLAHLVEIDRRKQAVPPAEGRVGVDDDVRGLAGFER